MSVAFSARDSRYRNALWRPIPRVLTACCLLAAGCGESSPQQPAPVTVSAPSQSGSPDVGAAEMPSYEGKTAAQWIEELQGNADSESRMKAAEALGFLAREGRLTPGGFSDVPIDSPEPPELSEDELRSIVAALAEGLKDPERRVRASSAIALSWIGPRAHAAVPGLISLLHVDDERVRDNALAAIGRIGPAASEAISHLEPMLAGEDPFLRLHVAEALRLIGARPESFIPTLIEFLGQSRSSFADHYAAIELAHLGDPAVPALKQALQDKNATLRKNAAYAFSNMAGWDNLTKDRDSVADALIELARDEDSSVVFKAVQALGSVRAAPERSVPVLVSLLKHADESVAQEAAESLGDFGADARSALPALIDSLPNVATAAYAIREIGLDRESADLIRKVKTAEGYWLFVPLCEYPESATEFLGRNPEAVDVPWVDHEALVRLMRDPDPRFSELNDLLYKSEHLPLPLIASLGDSRFLTLIQRKLKTADAHEKTLWDACARACGTPAERVVTIDETHPGDFKPKSAWPDTDPSRMSENSRGHGDGQATVIVTGSLLGEGGRKVSAPRFYRMNDSWVLGDESKFEEPIHLNEANGRFVYVTNVFAAFSHGDGPREPGPYQTGSSIVLIECEGFKPLQVRFFDEMPDVRITLSIAEAKPSK